MYFLNHFKGPSVHLKPRPWGCKVFDNVPARGLEAANSFCLRSFHCGFKEQSFSLGIKERMLYYIRQVLLRSGTSVPVGLQTEVWDNLHWSSLGLSVNNPIQPKGLYWGNVKERQPATHDTLCTNIHKNMKSTTKYTDLIHWTRDLDKSCPAAT